MKWVRAGTGSQCSWLIGMKRSRARGHVKKAHFFDFQFNENARKTAAHTGGSKPPPVPPSRHPNSLSGNRRYPSTSVFLRVLRGKFLHELNTAYHEEQKRESGTRSAFGHALPVPCELGYKCISECKSDLDRSFEICRGIE